MRGITKAIQKYMSNKQYQYRVNVSETVIKLWWIEAYSSVFKLCKWVSVVKKTLSNTAHTLSLILLMPSNTAHLLSNIVHPLLYCTFSLILHTLSRILLMPSNTAHLLSNIVHPLLYYTHYL